MSQTKVKAAVIDAVNKRLTALDANVKVAWPNKAITPPTSSRWFSVSYFAGKTAARTLGPQGDNEVRGFVQVDVNVPTNSGDKEQNDALTALEAWFTEGRRVTLNGQTVTITSSERSNGRNAESCWRISLSIYFYATYQRNALT